MNPPLNDGNEIEYTSDESGLTVSARSSGQVDGRLQDSHFFEKRTTPVLNATHWLLRLFKNAAQAVNFQANNMDVGATSCVAHVLPSGNVVTGNTGDAHAVLFTVIPKGDAIEINAQMLTENQHDSFAYFSASNTEKASINRGSNTAALPTIKEHIINRDLPAGSKVLVGLFTDGALPGIDNRDADTHSVLQRAKNAVQTWVQNDPEWQTGKCKLAPYFVKQARDDGEKDCATAVVIDITDPPRLGVTAGVLDGHKATGSGRFARTLRDTMRKLVNPSSENQRITQGQNHGLLAPEIRTL